MKILKKSKLADGSKLELVEKETDKFEILLNGKVQAKEFDYNRACETFEFSCILQLNSKVKKSC